MNSFLPAPYPRRSRGFTLIELLTVIAIIGILAAIIIPVVGKVRSTARTSQSISNLRQIGMGINLYAEDNKGLIPDDNSIENVSGVSSAVFWSLALNPYVGRGKTDGNSDISSFFTCPVYQSMIGTDLPVGRGGYTMNRRMYYANGSALNPWDSAGIWSSKRTRLGAYKDPSRTVVIAFGYFEGFAPNADGTMPDERLSQPNTTPVPHNRRIGAGSNGTGGAAGGYLMLDGSAKVMTPAEAANYLKLRS